MPDFMQMLAPKGLPDFKPGNNLAVSIAQTLEQQNIRLQDGDILVRQLVIPADIAELDRNEICNMLSRITTGNGVAIARAKDGGTNALLCAPANAIPFCFGNNSAHRHAQLTRLSDLTCEVVDLEKLSADIDVPEDLNTSLFADIAFGSKEREGAFQYA